MRDGIAIAEAGAFSLVIEGVAESLARELTEAVAVPTIGIGGSPSCDGQILVIDDLLGLFTEFTPKFVKRYRQLGDEIRWRLYDVTFPGTFVGFGRFQCGELAGQQRSRHEMAAAQREPRLDRLRVALEVHDAQFRAALTLRIL